MREMRSVRHSELERGDLEGALTSMFALESDYDGKMWFLGM